MRKTKAEKQMDTDYDVAFKIHAQCIEFNIMDLGEMRRIFGELVKKGMGVDHAIKSVIELYRKSFNCNKCGLSFQFHWLKDGVCNGCRNPHLIVKSQTS